MFRPAIPATIHRPLGSVPLSARISGEWQLTVCRVSKSLPGVAIKGEDDSACHDNGPSRKRGTHQLSTFFAFISAGRGLDGATAELGPRTLYRRTTTSADPAPSPKPPATREPLRPQAVPRGYRSGAVRLFSRSADSNNPTARIALADVTLPALVLVSPTRCGSDLDLREFAARLERAPRRSH